MISVESLSEGYTNEPFSKLDSNISVFLLKKMQHFFHSSVIALHYPDLYLGGLVVLHFYLPSIVYVAGNSF